jgi:LysM repeat protein
VENTSTQIASTQPSSVSTATPFVLSVSRSLASTPLPLPSNNFASLGYTFALLGPNGNILQEITLAVAPQDFFQSENSTSNIIYTAGDAFSDSYGAGLTEITMSGTFGQRPTGNSLVTNSTPLSTATSSGQYLVLQLRDMFRQYLDALNPLLTPNAKTNSQTVLQFYNPKDNEFWNIEPIGNWFQLSRSKSSPFLYRYKLSFVCLGKASSSSIFGLEDPLTIISNTTNAIGSAYAVGASVLTTISSNAAVIQNTLTQLAVSYVDFSANILTPFTSLQNAISSFLNLNTSVINYQPSQILTLQNYVSSVQVAMAPENGTPIVDPVTDNVLLQINQVCDSYRLYPNSFVKRFIKSDFVNQTTVYDLALRYIDLSQITSATAYTVKQGDSLEAISLKFFGDASYWKSLAEFNGLAYPYISQLYPQPDKTIAPGGVLSIPNVAGLTLSNNLILGANTDSLYDPASSLGTDLYLDGTGDVDFSNSSTGNDLVTVSGVPNIKQAVALKLNVNRGELIEHPYYGMTDFRGYRTSNLLSARASVEFTDTLLSDSRISSIQNQTVTINDDILNYQAGVVVNVSGQPIAVTGSLNLAQ